MSEPRDRLSAAFTELAVSMLPEVNLPGPDAAHATVRHRRRRRMAVIATAVAILILAPATAFALLRGNGSTDPDIGNTPTPSPSASPQPPRLRVITDAALGPPTPLDDALLPIPSFGPSTCPEGETQYTDGIWRGSMLNDNPSTYVWSWISAVTTGDVNQDGTMDWVAEIACDYGVDLGMSANQVVAFTRQGNDAYELLGPVIVAEPDRSARAAEVAADGIVRVAVGGPYEGAPPTPSEWRSFRWNGSGFAPVGTPLLIPVPEPSNLTLAVRPADTFLPTLTVTVHNAGTTSSDYLVLSFSSSAEVSMRPEGFSTDLQPNRAHECALEREILDEWARCFWTVILEPVPPRQSATGQFTFPGAGLVPVWTTDVTVEGVVVGAPAQRNATTENSVNISIQTTV